MVKLKTSLLNTFNCILDRSKHKSNTPYCRVCFHINSQRNLVPSEAFRTLTSMQNLNYEVKDDFFICHICEKNALTALHFCKAIIMARDVENLLEKLKGNSERFEEFMRELQDSKNTILYTEMMKCEKQLEAIRNRFKLSQSKMVNVNTRIDDVAFTPPRLPASSPSLLCPKPPREIAIKPSPPNIISKRKCRSTPYKIVITTNNIIDTNQKIAANRILDVGMMMNEKLIKTLIPPGKSLLKKKTLTKRTISTFTVPISNKLPTQVLIEQPTTVSNSIPLQDPLSVSHALPVLNSLPDVNPIPVGNSLPVVNPIPVVKPINVVNTKLLKTIPVSDKAPINPSEIMLHPIVIDAKGSIDVPSLSAKIVDGRLVYQDPTKPPIIVMKKPEVPFALNTKNIDTNIPITPIIVAGGFKKSETDREPIEILKKQELARMDIESDKSNVVFANITPTNVIDTTYYPKVVVNQSIENDKESLHETLIIKEENDDVTMSDDELLNVDDMKPISDETNSSYDKKLVVDMEGYKNEEYGTSETKDWAVDTSINFDSDDPLISPGIGGYRI